MLERIWWVRWACVGSEGRIGWAAKVGVFKSADVCIVDFAVSRKGERVLFLRMSWITAAVRSIVGGKLTKAASLLSATLRFADTLGCLDWKCTIKRM